MGLLSGGIILRKKRQLMQKLAPLLENKNDGNHITDFGDHNIYNLKCEMKDVMNRIAGTLDEDTKNKLIEEGRTVYALNNELIRSVKGANAVVLKKVVSLVGISVFFIFVFYVLLK